VSGRLELFATILLACAAVLTAWATYESAQWRGQQGLRISRATTARIQSSEAATRAGQLTQVDVATFIQWVDAYAKGDTRLAAFYRRRFRDEFKPAFAAWLATHPRTNPNAPKTPFELPQYRPAERTKSTALDALADARFRSAEQANNHSNDYVLAVVLLASVLLFAGLATKTGRYRELLFGLGLVIFVSTLAWLAVSPIRL
jgi:hypothetical protein